MKKHTFLPVIMAIAITACDKESFTPAIPSIDRSLYTEFSEPAEKVETFTAVLRDKELFVTGITVSHSHYNDLTFKAVVKDINSGSVTNVTDKAIWHIPAIYNMRATKGIVKSNYKEITTLRKGYDGEIPEYGVFPAESGLMKVSYNGLEVNIPYEVSENNQCVFRTPDPKECCR